MLRLALNGTAHNNTENSTFPLIIVRLSLSLVPLLGLPHAHIHLSIGSLNRGVSTTSHKTILNRFVRQSTTCPDKIINIWICTASLIEPYTIVKFNFYTIPSFTAFTAACTRSFTHIFCKIEHTCAFAV